MKWKTIELGEVLTLQRGFDITKNEQKNGEYPVVSSSGIQSFHNDFRVKGEGVVIGRKGSLGTCFFLKQDFWAHDTTLFVKDFKGNHRRFIFYLLQTLNLAGLDVGSSNPTLNRNHAHKIKVTIPEEYETQQKIASILSTYDDLIENNLKRIRLLEEAAQRLYQEWFVRFRFPGWEEVRFLEGLPEGWERKTLGEICQLIMGQSPSSDFYNESGEGLPFHQGVTNYGDRFVSHQTYCTNPTRIAEEGDILCSVRAPVGRLNITLDKIIIGRGISAIRNRGNFQTFQFYQLKSHFVQEDMIGGGTIFSSVTKKELENQMFVYPSKVLVKAFEKTCRPMDAQIKTLHLQNQKLKEARDILLPRLMSGSIEV